MKSKIGSTATRTSTTKLRMIQAIVVVLAASHCSASWAASMAFRQDGTPQDMKPRPGSAGIAVSYDLHHEKLEYQPFRSELRLVIFSSVLRHEEVTKKTLRASQKPLLSARAFRQTAAPVLCSAGAADLGRPAHAPAPGQFLPRLPAAGWRAMCLSGRPLRSARVSASRRRWAN